jgi:hypothetical protein
MKYPSPQDIEEMRARGFDRSVIEEAIELSKRWSLQERLKEQIRAAFAGVKLGDGVGLHEAQGLDDYASEEKCAEYRASDEKGNWQALGAKQLNECYSSLSFFDSEGMRFHLPAYLIADLEGTYQHGMAFALTQSSGRDEQFALLNESQSAAVRAYLQFIEHEPEYEFDREHIRAALEGFWAE